MYSAPIYRSYFYSTSLFPKSKRWSSKSFISGNIFAPNIMFAFPKLLFLGDKSLIKF